MVALVALMPQPKARSELFHFGESRGGSRMGRMSGIKAPCVNRRLAPRGLREAQAALSPQIEIPQHEAGATRLADAVAEVVGLGPRVGADPHLVERVGAAAALHRAQDTGITIADHRTQIPDCAVVHRQRLVAV